MLNSKNDNFYDILFSNSKVIRNKNSHEKNISEGLLTIRTLVLTQHFQHEAEEASQLEKILTACRLQKENYKVETAIDSWTFYRKNDNIKEVLLFGITEKDLNLDIHLSENQINRFDSRIFIKTASIAAMLSNQLIKNELWQNALKPHFVS